MDEATIDHHCVTLLSSLGCRARKDPETPFHWFDRTSPTSKYMHTHLYVHWEGSKQKMILIGSKTSPRIKRTFCHKIDFSFSRLLITRGKNYLEDELLR